MSKITCDIIKDLIPLYVDEVCSQDTKQCVDEHISECAECREFLKFCKNEALSAETLENHQFDAMKKVKKKLRSQRILIGVFLIVLIWFGIGSATGSMLWQTNGILNLDYYLLFPVFLLVYVLLLNSHKAIQKPQKRDLILTAASAVITVFYLFFYRKAFVSALKNGSYLGLPAHKVGPLLDMVFILLFFVQFVMFLHGLFRLLKKDRDTGFCGIVHLTGMFLLLEYIEHAYHMENYEASAAAFSTANIFFPTVGLIACLILCIMDYVHKKSGKTHKL